jgi:iron complex transport system ATP-binding protein
VICWRNVTVDLGGLRILEGVDLDVATGEWVGLIGPNGAGKTTLLRAAIGAVRPTAGSVLIDGESHLGSLERARRVAWVPQRPFAPPGVTVFDYVMLGRNPHIPYFGTERPRDVAAVWAALEALELEALADRDVAVLSGGEFQRAVLARAVAQDAPILLLDEPTSSLDVGHQQQVLGLVDRLRSERALTVVSALHDLTLAAQFCPRLVMLAAGRVVADGSAKDVLTEQRLAIHYGATVRVREDPEAGVVVVPVRNRPGTSG